MMVLALLAYSRSYRLRNQSHKEIRDIKQLSESPTSQPKLVRGLLNPGAYPLRERPSSVRLQETHISWLFFTGQFVYKVKKPVNFGFLDFSTLEKRHFYCQEEVRLNSRLAPDVYLSTVEIRKFKDKHTFCNRGKTVEYAVKMRQLPQNRWLSTLLEGGKVESNLIHGIAKLLAQFHANAETNQQITRIGGWEGLCKCIEENFVQTERFIGETINLHTYDTIRVFTEIFKEINQGLFKNREMEGRIRDGHGDLHAAQICIENNISIIDCIEFNKRLRYCDVATDLAFLAMDFDHYHRQDLSKILVNQYIALTKDVEIPHILPFLKCYRAYVRGKVESLRQNQLKLHPDEKRAISKRARNYFNLAHEYALLGGPILIITTGLMGSGKSTLAKAISPRLKANLLVSDRIRKELAKIPLKEPQFAPWGKGIYSAEFHRRTYEALHHRALEKLMNGLIVIIDASYSEKTWRDQAQAIAHQAGAPLLVLKTLCPETNLRQRLDQRQKRKGSISDGRVELLETQKFNYQSPTEVPENQRILVDTSFDVETVISTTLKEIYRSQLCP